MNFYLENMRGVIGITASHGTQTLNKLESKRLPFKSGK